MGKTNKDSQIEKSLRRVISAPLLVLYGVGTMLGAGIYALIGEVVGVSGVYAPAAFILASIIAALTAASFAELSSRLPKSAGPAAYVLAGFKNQRLSFVTGLLIVASGIVSAGVMLRGFVGYAGEFLDFPDWAGFVVLSITIGAIAAWGIAESLVVVAIITVLETGALLVVIALGLGAEPVTSVASHPMNVSVALGVVSGAVLAFYAFIGFEDMVNVAEEVKQPHRTIPKSIFAAFIVTTVIYVLVSWVAIRTTPISLLQQSESPMTLIFSHLTNGSTKLMSVVAMIAVINGALVQVIMASRILYGMAKQNTISAWFGRVGGHTRTPINATFFVIVLVFLAALMLPLTILAQVTSFLLLSVFTFVNAALIRIKKENPASNAFKVPIIVPYLGAAAAALLALASLVEIMG